MRSVLFLALAVTGLRCANPAAEDEQLCFGDDLVEARCAWVPPGVRVERSETEVATGWLDLPPGEATFVFRADTRLEIGSVEVDGEILFRYPDGGVEQRLGARPFGDPTTLRVPASETLRVFLTAPESPHLGLTWDRFVRDAPGEELALHFVDLVGVSEERIDAVVAEVDAILPIRISHRLERPPRSFIERAEETRFSSEVVRPIGAREGAELTVHLVGEIETFVAGRTVSTPVAPFDHEASLRIDPELAGDRFGRILAHEIGHALGLFHLSEASGVQLEGLADTPTCLRDVDGDGRVGAADCPEAARNLMFWTEGGTELTPMQREVIRRSPLLR